MAINTQSNVNGMISVVAPIYNEEENIENFFRELVPALEKCGRPFEIWAVDDGSKDRSYELLERQHKADPRIKVIRLRTNFGQTAALTAGFDAANGDIIVTLDADLQNDPADIPKLLEKIDQGYDIAAGWRFDRQDDFVSRKLPSMLANRLISMTTNVRLHDYGCTLKAFRKDVVKNVRLYGEMHRFIPAIASWMGVRIAEVKVNHRPRTAGTSKYGISRTVRVVLDLVTVKFLLTYITRPMQIFGLMGLLTGGIGFFSLLYLTFVKFALDQPISNRPLLSFGILFLILGVQFVSMGLLGEFLARIYHESQDKPIYYIREKLD